MADTNIEFNPTSNEVVCSGDWDLAHLQNLQDCLSRLTLPNNKSISINGKQVTQIDSAGAWVLLNWEKKLSAQGYQFKLKDFPGSADVLLKMVNQQVEEEGSIPQIKQLGWVTNLGKLTVEQLKEFQEYLAFVGFLTYEAIRVFSVASRSRLVSYATVIYQSGYQALFIIALLSGMIGVVIAYQLGVQLRNYGADIYIVDLLGLSILREFAPLITAIMVAGRTGSAFTAQLGMMRLNQEIDALNTMGVTPAEVLVIPRIVGLFIVLPLLTIWSNIFGVIGGMMMTQFSLGISCYDFLERFPTVIPLKTLFIGLGKTPVFALIIASIGCYEGMKVSGGAESLGRNTTRSVVMSIFFIIVADAIFSVIFSKLQL